MIELNAPKKASMEEVKLVLDEHGIVMAFREYGLGGLPSPGNANSEGMPGKCNRNSEGGIHRTCCPRSIRKWEPKCQRCDDPCMCVQMLMEAMIE